MLYNTTYYAHPDLLEFGHSVFFEPIYFFNAYAHCSTINNLNTSWIVECQQLVTVHACAQLHQLPARHHDDDQEGMLY